METGMETEMETGMETEMETGMETEMETQPAALRGGSRNEASGGLYESAWSRGRWGVAWFAVVCCFVLGGCSVLALSVLAGLRWALDWLLGWDGGGHALGLVVMVFVRVRVWCCWFLIAGLVCGCWSVVTDLQQRPLTSYRSLLRRPAGQQRGI
ncbi:hypothetical protein C7974DRAFT_401506 [Boeremia exigua]|uniref:uncharacterized protein n=1 Tax=Boeremia exigua TaxID=749465 RepID=UPI001E8EAB17|nr:uncharacterized protein C7974DRAFT_401506 [Boeremia exigua]KAH6616272.1 hypothetical protein C7974DRAFT_401506 [Boeremia exigua]